ncbi:hypothetical protein HNP84_000315 [Thermocatellispora tengchongensis]|uniref:Uncharacterized protein n=1 Tax=Thermocatellispora tengchongensis TaxID=1073253 RepID=A0A840P039_9ACTN|nr:hypothetical protein [Thermocatellispora tengchongensis]MBB5130627.1 hypothetical protein [Thermocatellispora tengchongensis]
MLAVQLAELNGAEPAGVAQALELVTGFDDALAHGFARLGEERSAALGALAGALSGTPLGARAAEAAEKVAAGSIADDHLVALAGGRTAVLGAVHDALLTGLDAALGRTRAEWAPQAGEAPAYGENLLAGCRSWLHELAITGWRGVDHDLVAASGQMIDALLAEPALRRPAVLLDGLAAELRANCPVATMDRLPARRWADMWARGMMLAQPRALPEGGADTVSGRVTVLGVELHEHGTAVQAQAHGLLEPTGGGPVRLVRISVSAAKVDTILGPAVWRLLGGCPVLLGALAGHHAVEIDGMPLRDSGDLVWREDLARPGTPVDPFAAARVHLAGALAPAVPPLDRHPVRIAEPVLLEGYKAVKDDDGLRFDLGGGDALPVDLDRLSPSGPLTPQLVAASTACLGLLRWDAGEWSVQPLGVQTKVKRETVAVHNGDWALGPTDPKVVKAEARAGDAVAVLRERAGRLLRK